MLLSEAFRSLQYSLGVGWGQEEWAWGAGLGRVSRLPNKCAWPFAETPKPQGGAGICLQVAALHAWQAPRSD